MGLLGDIGQSIVEGFGSGFGGGLGSSIGGASIGAITQGLAGGGEGLSGHDALVHGDYWRRLAQKNWELQFNRLGLHPVSTRMRDLKNAGINPILAAREGLSSSGSGGSQPSFQTGAVADKSARQSARAALQQASAVTAKTLSEKRLLDKQGDLVGAQTSHEGVKEGYTTEMTRTEWYKQGNIEEDTKLKIKQKLTEMERRDEVIASTDLQNQRLKGLEQILKNDQQKLNEMLTRYPGMLTNQRIEESKVWEAAQWLQKVGDPVIHSAGKIAAGAGVFSLLKKVIYGQGLKTGAMNETAKWTKAGRYNYSTGKWSNPYGN